MEKELKRNRAILPITPELLLSLIGLPKEFQYITVHYNHIRDNFDFLVENENVVKVNKGERFPELEVIMENILTNIKYCKIKQINILPYNFNSEEKTIYKNEDDMVKVELKKETWNRLEELQSKYKFDIDNIILSALDTLNIIESQV